ncbi:MAG: hypothetical protein A4E59_00288 [Syntrophorhabdus sp. PtaB.Bin027]|nr:MAG: hypothetical protein A4E59_00288 [Syntrophorhabdus sp. PtaB.Bin027]
MGVLVNDVVDSISFPFLPCKGFANGTGVHTIFNVHLRGNISMHSKVLCNCFPDALNLAGNEIDIICWFQQFHKIGCKGKKLIAFVSLEKALC